MFVLTVSGWQIFANMILKRSSTAVQSAFLKLDVFGVCVCVFLCVIHRGCDLQDINRLWELLKSPHKQSLSLEWVGDQVTLITFGLLGGSPARAENSGLDGWLGG